MQRAVRDDIIYDKHTGLANFISIFGESPRQINVWLCRRPNLTAAQQHTLAHLR